MERKPRLILINGPAGIGKSTIARRYIKDHSLALMISNDDIISSMGQWLAHEDEARDLTFALIKVMTEQHLTSGYDVILPYLIVKAEEVAVLEQIANQHDAQFIECALMAPKQESVQRLMDRGTWGEPDSPPLVAEDKPIIEELYDQMHAVLSSRPNTVIIQSVKDDIDGTYTQIQQSLNH